MKVGQKGKPLLWNKLFILFFVLLMVSYVLFAIFYCKMLYFFKHVSFNDGVLGLL